MTIRRHNHYRPRSIIQPIVNTGRWNHYRRRRDISGRIGRGHDSHRAISRDISGTGLNAKMEIAIAYI